MQPQADCLVPAIQRDARAHPAALRSSKEQHLRQAPDALQLHVPAVESSCSVDNDVTRRIPDCDLDCLTMTARFSLVCREDAVGPGPRVADTG